MVNSSVKRHFAKRLSKMGGSPIREMLSQAGKEGFISFGGGCPAPESFPVGVIDALRKSVRGKYGESIYQYGRTEGFPPLIKQLPAFLSRENRQVVASDENILITTGSQQALFILGQMFINPGDKIAVESPTYLGALQAFSFCQPQYVEITTDDDGIVPEHLDEILTRQPEIKFVYTVPTFQNPTGKTISLERKMAIADILKEHKKFAVEDDPYSELRYEGKPIPSLQSLAQEYVIHLFTFSKTLAPDFRIGGLIAPNEIRDTAIIIKQGLDLYTSNYDQAIVAEYLAGGHLERHIPEIITLYKPRRDAMAASIKAYFPDIFDFTYPKGGMFLWAFLKKEAQEYANRLNIVSIKDEAIKKNVGFVPGAPFFARKDNVPVSMRLNFTNQPEPKIEQGIEIIGKILQQRLEHF